MAYGNQDKEIDGSANTKMQPASPPLTPAAERALAEAVARRKAQVERLKVHRENEIAGRGGLDPTRFGDWEVDGIASDF